MIATSLFTTAAPAAPSPPDPFASQRPGTLLLVPFTGGATGSVWKYTTRQPADAWQSAAFGDSDWKSGAMPFGAGRAFVGPWRTRWTESGIWLRKTVELEAAVTDRLVVKLFHDEDAEVYVNGKLVLLRKGYVTAPEVTPLAPEFSKLLRPGANVIAIHCRQTRGGQGIALGLLAVGEEALAELLREARAVRPPAAPRPGGAAPDKRTDGDLLTTRWGKKVSADNVWPEYPRPTMVRDKWLNLNGLWDYALVGSAQRPQPARLVNAEADPLLKGAPTPPTQWDGKILVPFAPESVLSGVSRFVWPSQILWYRREVRLPADWQGQRVLLHFEAVDWHCVVWANGKQVGEHKGGYTPFTCDLTEAVRSGETQELLVAVWDPTNAGDQSVGKQRLPTGGEGRYPPSSGIWQTVWLEPVPSVSIDQLLLTPEVAEGRVVASAKLRGDGAGHQLEVRVLDGQRVVAATTGEASQPLILDIPQPKLWSPDSPFLYEVTATLRRNGETIDRVASYVGMREIAIQPDAAGLPRIELNGQPMFLFGPLDQGIWPDGILTPPSDAAGKFEVQYLKSIGCNLARFHIIVHPRRWYYWCDKLGLIVFQDFVCKRRKETPTDSPAARQWEAEQRELMDHLRPHPSLALWYVFNESWGQYDTERITRWAMDYDPTRLVCNATGWVDSPVGHTFDMHDYSFHPSVAMPGESGERAMVIGECGGFNVFVPGHTTGNYPPKQNFDPAGDDFRPSFWDGAKLEQPYADWVDGLWVLRTQGLCGAIYTQIYDTGGECNGWLTYDREVSKLPVDTLNRLHQRLYRPLPELRPVAPLLKSGGQTCRWREAPAPTGWELPEFDDSEWSSTDAPLRADKLLCARRSFTLDRVLKRAAMVGDGWTEFTVWLNGKQVQTFSNGRTESYAPRSLVLLSPQALKALHPGNNVLAVTTNSSQGKMRKRGDLGPEDRVDFGLVEVIERD